MASVSRVRLGLTSAVVCALAAAALTVAPPTAGAVGALGPLKALSGPTTSGGELPPAIASLADGSTAVAWTSIDGKKIFVRTRGPHTGAWSAVRSVSLTAGWAIDIGLLNASAPTLTPLGASRFLLVWHEKNGSNVRVRTARFTTASALTFDTVSADSPQTIRVAANSSGRAVVSWTNTATTRSWFSVLNAPTSGWSTPALVAGNVASAFPVPAVAMNGTICLIWLDTAGGMVERSRCRATAAAPTAGHTWVSGFGTVRSLGPAFSLSEPQVADLAASGNRFVAAVTKIEAGSASLAGGSPYPASSIRAYELGSAAATAWSQRAVYRQPNQLLVYPTLRSASDGSVALRILRLQGDIAVTTTHYGATTYVAGRTPAGAWSPMRMVSTFGIGDPTVLFVYNSIAVGPGGLVAVTSMSPRSGAIPSFTMTAAVGSAAGGFLQRGALASTAFTTVPAIAGTGQITYAVGTWDGASVTVSVRTTALAGGAS